MQTSPLFTTNVPLSQTLSCYRHEEHHCSVSKTGNWKLRKQRQTLIMPDHKHHRLLHTAQAPYHHFILSALTCTTSVPVFQKKSSSSHCFPHRNFFNNALTFIPPKHLYLYKLWPSLPPYEPHLLVKGLCRCLQIYIRAHQLWIW